MEISKGVLIMVCDGLYQTNMDDNKGDTVWGIKCKDMDRKSWGSFTTTTKVDNAHYHK